MIGDVWEWTSSDFAGYPGFESFPYTEYSEVFFGTEYKVLRGGSWATRPGASATRSATGTTRFAARSSAASGARATMKKAIALRTSCGATPRYTVTLAAADVGDVRDGLAAAERAVAEVFLRRARLGAVRGDHAAPRVLSHARRALAARAANRRRSSRSPGSLVELGAGSAAKTRIILDAMRARDAPSVTCRST